MANANKYSSGRNWLDRLLVRGTDEQIALDEKERLHRKVEKRRKELNQALQENGCAPVSATPVQASPDGAVETQLHKEQPAASKGMDYLRKAMAEDPVLKNSYETLLTFLGLVKIHLRPRRRGEESLLEYLGFNADVLLKYAAAIFGDMYPEKRFNNTRAIRALLEETGTETPEEKRKRKLDAAIPCSLMTLDDDDETVTMAKIRRLREKMEQLSALFALPDITNIKRTVRAVGMAEKSGKWTDAHNQILLALSEGGYRRPISKDDRIEALIADMAMIEKMIAENADDNVGRANVPGSAPEGDDEQAIPVIAPASSPAPQRAARAAKPTATRAAEPRRATDPGHSNARPQTPQPARPTPPPPPPAPRSGKKLLARQASAQLNLPANAETKAAAERLQAILDLLLLKKDVERQQKIINFLNSLVALTGMALGTRMSESNETDILLFIAEEYGTDDADELLMAINDLDAAIDAPINFKGKNVSPYQILKIVR